MVRSNEGLTKIYNRFHDREERNPEIVKLRALHAAMDRAVLDAYDGTTSRPTAISFSTTKSTKKSGAGGKSPGATAGPMMFMMKSWPGSWN